MHRPRSPLALLAGIFAGWVNRHQRGVIDYLLEENQILRAKLGKPRLQFTDAERRRLARKGGPLGRRILEAVAQIVTPDTILAWHRKLVAAKWTYNARGSRRKTDARQEIEALVVRFATENPDWGYDKIQGALMNLGHDVAPNTIKAILKRHGIEPVAGTPTPHLLEALLEGPRGFDRRDRLLHHRSLDRLAASSPTTSSSRSTMRAGRSRSSARPLIPTSIS